LNISEALGTYCQISVQKDRAGLHFHKQGEQALVWLRREAYSFCITDEETEPKDMKAVI
jgi:hypothetical protein